MMDTPALSADDKIESQSPYPVTVIGPNIVTAIAPPIIIKNHNNVINVYNSFKFVHPLEMQ